MSQVEKTAEARKEVRLRIFRGMGNDPSSHRYDTFTVPHRKAWWCSTRYTTSRATSTHRSRPDGTARRALRVLLG